MDQIETARRSSASLLARRQNLASLWQGQNVMQSILATCLTERACICGRVSIDLQTGVARDTRQNHSTPLITFHTHPSTFVMRLNDRSSVRRLGQSSSAAVDAKHLPWRFMEMARERSVSPPEPSRCSHGVIVFFLCFLLGSPFDNVSITWDSCKPRGASKSGMLPFYVLAAKHVTIPTL